MPRVWGYVRVSDELQLGHVTVIDDKVVDDTSIQTQTHQILTWWEHNRHQFPDHEFDGEDCIFSDPAQSARKIPLAQRPQGSVMMSFLGRGDIILAADFERVFRSPKDYFETMEALANKGVQFKFLNMPGIDWSTDEGSLIGGQLALVKQYEAKCTSRRIRTANLSRHMRGIPSSGFIPPGWGKYTRLIKGKVVKTFVENEPERKLMRILASIVQNDREHWGFTDFYLLANHYDFRRISLDGKPTGRWTWREFQLMPVYVATGFPRYALAHSFRGYYWDRILPLVAHDPGLFVPVRRLTRETKQPGSRALLEAVRSAKASVSSHPE